MKAIILAGGRGSRLYPLTQITTKQLLPIHDKPLIYYPLSLLMLCGIREVLLISTPEDLPLFEKLLKNGEQLGIRISYLEQLQPKGLAEAFIIGDSFIGDDNVMLILGDNLFYGNFNVFRNAIKKQQAKNDGVDARIFAYAVSDPERYGVIEFDKSTGKVTSIEEKPIKPKSNYAIPGLYIFDKTVSKRAKNLTPSNRGELEITDLIKSYLRENRLGVEIIPRGMAWLDTGTPQSLMEAHSFIATIEDRQGLKIACLEEIAYRMKYIDETQLKQLIEQIPECEYKGYLKNILDELNLT